MKKLFFTLVFIFIFGFISYSQLAKLNKGIILGTVIDQNQKPLQYATVSVLNTKDSLVAGKMTDTTGMFLFRDIPFGMYKVEVKFIGFKRKVISNIKLSKDTPFVNIGKIEILPEGKELQGVEITGVKSTVKYEVDKKVVYPSKDLQANGGSAADALRSVPSVQVDIEGNVSLRGSNNFQVLINGKPTVLEGSEALKQIPAANISRIEIITNPSAKYDPDGVAGIINIITKKGADEGLSGKISLSFDNFGSKQINAYIMYRKRKIETLLEISYYNKTQQLFYNSNMTIFDNTFLNSDTITNTFYPYSLKFSFNFFPNDKNTLTYNFQIGKKNFSFNTIGKKSQWINNQSTFFYENIQNSHSGPYFQSDINYEHKTQNSKLASFIQMSYFLEKQNNSLRYDTTDSDFKLLENKIFMQKVSSSKKQMKGRFQTDYTKKIGQGQLETGVALRYLNEKLNLNFLTFNNNLNSWIENAEYSYPLNFNRTIAAAYITYSNNFAFLNYKIGLRAEYTDRYIEIKDAKTRILRWDYFPSLHLNTKTKNNWNFQLGYSRRINRPSIWQLDSIPIFVNINTINYGNPYILPELTDSYEFNVMKKFSHNSISVETYYRYGHNPFSQIQKPLDERTSLWTWVNADFSEALGSEISTNLILFHLFMLYASADFYKYRIKGTLETQQIDKQSFIYNGKAFLMMMLPTKTMIQVGAFMTGKQITLSGQRSPLWVSIGGLRQSFLKNRINLSFTIIGLFNKLALDMTSNLNGFVSTTHIEMPRNYMFSLSVRLGHFKDTFRKMHKDQQQENNSIPFMGTGTY